MTKRTVIFGFIGTQLDSGGGGRRWEKWRPTVALTQQADLLVHRIELFHSGRHTHLLDQLRADIGKVSPETQVRPVELAIEDPWDFGQVYAALHDHARGYAFRPEEEEYWVHITTGTHVAQICLFLMVEARYIPGVLLQTAPPKKQQENQPGTYALIDLDLSRYDIIARRFAREHADAVSLLKSGIATRNARFNKMIGEIEQVALKSRAPMLLMGPTGAGKSFLARRVFDLKKVRHQLAGNFVEVNCATLRGEGAGSALFGHVKGAFTGAASERAGLLRSADKGLLFLDEIGELGLDEQAMLLKAVEEKRFLPMGGDREVGSDFQLIAGTNRDLRVEVARGRFREDLYARVNLWTYELPGLAQRAEDIAPNIDYLLARHSEEAGAQARFNTEARERYLRFAASAEAPWRGNFRDLSASITRMATLAEGGRIGDAQVTGEIERLRAQWAIEAGEPRAPADLEALLGAPALEQIDLFDQMQLANVISVCRAERNLSQAGRRLFAASRRAKESANDADRLRKYLSRFGLDWKAVTA
ncbi:MAG: sigma-54 interacting protein [Betaproteobacteria bacterium]|nr:sigma-54 interacting protein [Betaproteobacteria bacterium]